MERSVESRKMIFSQLVNDYPNTINKNRFRIYPQMPTSQILHYLKIAARKESTIIVQLEPSTHSNHFTEISGEITLSNKTSHIILTPTNERTIHLIQAKHIHHLRLAN